MGPRSLHTAVLAATLAACKPPAPPAPAAPPPTTAPTPIQTADSCDVDSYDAAITIDPPAKTVTGQVRITAHCTGPTPQLTLSAPGLTIDRLDVDAPRGAPVVTPGQLELPLAGPGPHHIELAYHGAPTRGLLFSDAAIHTIFHTDRWLPIRDVPGDKATLTLQLTLPSNLDVVATGSLRDRKALPDGTTTHTFHLDRPHAAYLFGFAAGQFNYHHTTTGPVALTYASTDRTIDLARAFADTAPILQFFTDRAGVAYPLPGYTQVLIPDASPQELAGMAILPAAHAAELLAEPREDWAIAHELAHQWWGNLVTCAEWSDFWMNEAFATFMVAAYKQQRWGDDEYDRELFLARRRWARIREAGEDRPMAPPGRVSSNAVSGPLNYAKGMAVLHLLRRQLGEPAFWSGVQTFVRTHAGASATTANLRTAMETTSGQPLAPFFDRWILGAGIPTVTAIHRIDGSTLVITFENPSPAWPLDVQLAVETDQGRTLHPVALTTAHHEFRIPLSGRLRSLHIDADSRLPFTIPHPRPPAMLLHQLHHEPTALARADALILLTSTCAATPCPELRAALTDRVEHDTSRLVRKLATDALNQ